MLSFHHSPLSFYFWGSETQKFDLWYPDKGFNFNKLGVLKKSADRDFPGGQGGFRLLSFHGRGFGIQSLVGELRFHQLHKHSQKSEKMPEIYVKIIAKVRPRHIHMKMLSHLPPPPHPSSTPPNFASEESRLGTCLVPATSQAKCWTSPPLRPAPPPFPTPPDGL